MTETPFLEDITLEDSRRIGNQIANLEVGDRVRVTNHQWDRYVEGDVIETQSPDGEECYGVTIRDADGDEFLIHANWRDIPPDSDDQETPYTGAISADIYDTAPAVTDIEVVQSTTRTSTFVSSSR